MGDGVVVELKIVFWSFLTGIGLMLLYYLLSIPIWLLLKNKTLRTLYEIIYWGICSVICFFILYVANGGVMRGFVIASLIFGMIISKNVLKYFDRRFKILLFKLKKKR